MNTESLELIVQRKGVANVNGPFCVIQSVLPSVSSSVKLLSVSGPLVGGLPARPTTVPPMLYVTAGQVTVTLLTFVVAVPLAVLV